MPSKDGNGSKNGSTFCPAKPLMAKASQVPIWVKRLRQLVKQTHGAGWILREHRGGRTQINRAYGDGTRSSVTVGIPWQSSKVPALLAYVERLDGYLQQGESLARAAELIHIEDHGLTAAKVRESKVSWPEVVERFHQHKINGDGAISERTWKLRYRLHMNEFLELMSEPGAPKNGNDVLETLITRFAHRCPPGGDGRGHRFCHVRDLLVFANTPKGGGAPKRWVPTIPKKELVGSKPKGKKKKASALRDVDALLVYRQIQNPKWQLAFGLMVCFGLRPAEVLCCRPEGGRLRVEGIKRNQSGEHEDRLVTALDPEGAPGMGANLLAVLEERGAEALPPRRDGFFATRMRDQLMKLEAWKSLVDDTVAAGKKTLTVYGLRHGYAYRGSMLYRLPLRVVANLMGHTLTVHMNHYGEELAAEEATDAVAEAFERVHGISMQATARQRN